MKRKLKRWGDRKILLPIRKTIKGGASTEKISVALTVGFILGLIPVYGVTTILITVVALTLRLNFISMQIAHFLVHPIQIALIVPFLKLGDYLFIKDGYSFTVQQYLMHFKEDFWSALNNFWMVNLYAIAIWFVLSLPLFFILYFGLKTMIHKLRPALIRQRV